MTVLENVTKPAHSCGVMTFSTSNGEMNQRVILEEFARTPEELVAKSMSMNEEVVAACFKWADKASEPYKGKK